MKVLMLGWELPPHNSGGLGVACYHMCRHLAFQGVSLQFILPYTAEHGIDFMEVTSAHPQDVTRVLRAGNAYASQRYRHIYRTGEHRDLTLYEQQALYEQNVQDLVEITEFDLIHAHDWLTLRAGMAAKRVSGKPLIAHIHATEYDRSGAQSGNSLVEEIEYQGMMMADRVITVSEHTKQVVMKHYGIPTDKIQVVHNSIALDEELDVHEGSNVYHYLQVMRQHGYKVVTNIGRLTIQKGLTHLLRAAKTVIDHQPKTYFLIVGSGDQYYELIDLAAELGISQNVLFAGFQRGKAWRDAFKVADLFVMPSVSEPFGLTPLESIGFGTPSLVSNQSGVAEIVHNLLRVDYWDEDMMADQIVNVLRSEGFRDTLQANAADELARMSWDDAAQAIRSVYADHLGQIEARI
jgi:glycosyltransferase involved in cell wall biosynthesis